MLLKKKIESENWTLSKSFVNVDDTKSFGPAYGYRTNYYKEYFNLFSLIYLYDQGTKGKDTQIITFDKSKIIKYFTWLASDDRRLDQGLMLSISGTDKVEYRHYQLNGLFHGFAWSYNEPAKTHFLSQSI